MNEAETRAEYIDPALKAAGWGVAEGSRILREYPITLGRIEGHGRRGKALTADYVLVYRNHKLAVIEAKAWDESLTEGVAQAKNYANKLAIRYTYSTNGRDLYGIDMTSGKEGVTDRYPTPDELWSLTFGEENAWRDRFADVPFEDKGGYFQARYYQDIAIERVLEAIAAGKSRIHTFSFQENHSFMSATYFRRWPCCAANRSTFAASVQNDPESRSARRGAGSYFAPDSAIVRSSLCAIGGWCSQRSS